MINQIKLKLGVDTFIKMRHVLDHKAQLHNSKIIILDEYNTWASVAIPIRSDLLK